MTRYDVKICCEGFVYGTERGKGLYTTSLCLPFPLTDIICLRLQKYLFLTS